MSEPSPNTAMPAQESVWDYPRPPRLEPTSKRIVVVFNGVVIAETQHAQRVLETSHPPVYYLPPGEVRRDLLSSSPHTTYCEWKGVAKYWSLEVGDRAIENVAWSYPTPTPSFAAIRDWIAFYPSRVDACYVDDERVQPQPGDFYGGWITSEIVGPFKGG